MKFPPLEYRRAEDLSSACELLAAEGARPLAGGQSLLPLLALRIARPSILVDLSRLEELKGVVLATGGVGGDVLSIGAVTTHADIEQEAAVAGHLPILGRVASHIGHLSIRHLGTIGGSVAHADPAAEWPATCVALGALAEITSRGGVRRAPVAELLVGPYQTSLADGEVISRLEFPLEPGRRLGMAEVARRPGDFALAGAVCSLTQREGATEAVVSFFGVEGRPRPIRLPALSSSELLDEAGREALSHEVAAQLEDVLEDVHASGTFRRHLARVALKRALGEALKEAA